MKKKLIPSLVKRLDEIKCDTEYRCFWNSLLDMPEYKQIRYFARIPDRPNPKPLILVTECPWSPFLSCRFIHMAGDWPKNINPNQNLDIRTLSPGEYDETEMVTKHEFKDYYDNGSINARQILLPWSFFEIPVIKKYDLLFFFDPLGDAPFDPFRHGNSVISRDARDIRPNTNPHQSTKQASKIHAQLNSIYRGYKDITPAEDMNPSTISKRKERKDPSKKALDDLRTKIHRDYDGINRKLLKGFLTTAKDHNLIQYDPKNGLTITIDEELRLSLANSIGDERYSQLLSLLNAISSKTPRSRSNDLSFIIP